MRHIARYYDLRGRERPFRVRARLASPFVLNDQVTLDSLLAYAVVREEMGADYWDQGVDATKPECLMRPPLPLKKTHTRGNSGNRASVWHGSACIVPENSARDLVRLKKHWDAAPQNERMVDYTGRGKIDTKAGPFKSWVMPHMTVSTPIVSWNGCGDATETLRLLRAFLPAIGKKRNAGYGLVRQWDVEATEVDASIVSVEGRIARPVPIPLDKVSLYTDVALQTYQPPYFLRQDARVCAAVGSRRTDGKVATFGVGES